jgi:hypothetical protein
MALCLFLVCALGLCLGVGSIAAADPMVITGGSAVVPGSVSLRVFAW